MHVGIRFVAYRLDFLGKAKWALENGADTVYVLAELVQNLGDLLFDVDVNGIVFVFQLQAEELC